MTNNDFEQLEIGVEYRFTDGNYYNILKVGLDKKNKRFYVMLPQFGLNHIHITFRKNSTYFDLSTSCGGFYFHDNIVDLSNWTATKIEKSDTSSDFSYIK